MPQLTPSDKPKRAKRQCLPKFRTSRPSNASTADTDLTKSWVTTVRFSEDLRIQMDAKERIHAPPAPATLETSSSSVSNDLDPGIPLDGDIEMASESATNTPTEAVQKRKRKRDRSNCVRLSIYDSHSILIRHFQSKLVEWLSLRDSTLDELLRHDGLGSSLGNMSCRLCSKVPLSALFRCQDCGHGSTLLCQDCLVLKHSDLELHQIQVSCFMKNQSFLPDFFFHPEMEWQVL